MFVGDVATAIADAVDGKTRAGAVYELGGPEVRTFKELMQFVLATTERKRLLLPLPFFLAKIKALVLQFMPSPLTLTPDQVELLRTDNVVSDAAIADERTLAGSRHRAGDDGGDRAVLSVALPQDRPVRQPSGRLTRLPEVRSRYSDAADDDAPPREQREGVALHVAQERFHHDRCRR